MTSNGIKSIQIETKDLQELEVGDNLIRNENGEVCELIGIIPRDHEYEANYKFVGFFVRKNVMKRFFKLSERGRFIVL